MYTQKKGTPVFVNFTQFEQQYGLVYTDEALNVFSDYIATRGCKSANGDVVDSSDQRNTLLNHVRWCLKFQCLSWALV